MPLGFGPKQKGSVCSFEPCREAEALGFTAFEVKKLAASQVDKYTPCDVSSDAHLAKMKMGLDGEVLPGQDMQGLWRVGGQAHCHPRDD